MAALLRRRHLGPAVGLLLGCADTETATTHWNCAPATAPIHLASRLDDDDGDGNPNDEDFPRINDEDDDIADHAWARDDRGVRHLFFHNEGLYGPHAIEHYTTSDLRTLEYVGIALTPEPQGWEADGLWAPHVVRHGDTWFLFYTGVEGTGAAARQRLGLATSRDLLQWTRVPSTVSVDGDGCIYECRESWTTWGAGGDFDDQCRDPFVLWDAQLQRWTLFATARSTNGYGVVTVAVSPDLRTWQGSGYIDASRRLPDGIAAQSTGGEAENPFVLQRNGTWTLLFTDWRDPEDEAGSKAPRTIVQYATSPHLHANANGSPHWLYRGYTPDPGVNAIEIQRLGEDIYVMSQSISNEASGAAELRRTLRLMCMSWIDDATFTTAPCQCDPLQQLPAAPTAPDTER